MPQSKKQNTRRKQKEKFSTDPPPAETKLEVLPNGLHAHTLKTENGTIIYMHFPEEMRKILWGLFAGFIMRLRLGQPLDFNDIAKSVGADQPYDITVDVDQSFVDETEECTKHALGLLDSLAPLLLVHASEQIVFEIFYRTMCDLRGIGSYQFEASESELIKLFAEHIVNRMRQRVTPKKKPSRKLEWTPERCEEFLVKYEYALDVLQKAKGIYQRNKDDEWKKMVKAVCTVLPDSFISRLPLRGDSEPHDMAREYAAELYQVNNTSYLKKVISRAKEARLQRVA